MGEGASESGQGAAEQDHLISQRRVEFRKGQSGERIRKVDSLFPIAIEGFD
jgi:hypothetical protein